MPVVWNSSGFETIDTLRRLEGHVQVYLPDLKYVDPEGASKYSRASATIRYMPKGRSSKCCARWGRISSTTRA